MLRLALGALALLLAAPAQARFIDDLHSARLDVEADEAGAPPAEGIQVHGRWTITVRNADGSIDRVVPFQNALAPTGATALVLAMLPSNSTAVKVDGIRVGAGDSANHPCQGATTPSPCEISGSDVLYDVIGSFSSTTGFVLIGSFQADRDGSIDEVATTISAFADNPVEGDEFAEKQLDTPIPVMAGQTVDVRVEITFE